MVVHGIACAIAQVGFDASECLGIFGLSALIGLAQYNVLRQYEGISFDWFTLTTVGVLAGMMGTVAAALIAIGWLPVLYFLIGGVGGSIVGGFQIRLLRPHATDKAFKWWLPANALAGSVFVVIYLSGLPSSLAPAWVVAAVGGIAYGLISGIPLRWLRRNPTVHGTRFGHDGQATPTPAS